MSVKIDTRPIWVLLGLKALRPLFFVTLAASFLYILGMPTPVGLTPVGQSAIAVFLLCLVLWITNVIPLAVTGILAMVLVQLLGVLSRKETYSLFGNEAVFFILGAFILAGAVMHSGIATRIALFMMGRFGSSPKRLVLTIFLLSAGLSFVMSEHAVAAMLFPIVLEISKSLGLKPGKSNYGKILFFALAWGCVIGGVATFLGGARVPLAVGILQETTGSRIGFLEYSVAVFPLVVVMLLAGYIILKHFFPVDIDRVEGAQGLVSKKLKALGKMTYTEYSVGAVLLVTIFAWAFLGESFGLSSVALISVVAMFVLRLVRWKDVEENVNWGIILMYGGAIVLGSALDKSGAAKWMVSSLVANWTGGPWTVFALFSFLSILLTAAISNAAVIAILLPVSIGMAQSLSIDPVLLTYAIAVPAGLDFMFPMGTPAIAIAASSNYISIRDSVKGGFIMFVLAWLAFNLVAAIWWPLIGMGY